MRSRFFPGLYLRALGLGTVGTYAIKIRKDDVAAHRALAGGYFQVAPPPPPAARGTDDDEITVTLQARNVEVAHQRVRKALPRDGAYKIGEITILDDD